MLCGFAKSDVNIPLLAYRNRRSRIQYRNNTAFCRTFICSTLPSYYTERDCNMPSPLLLLMEQCMYTYIYPCRASADYDKCMASRRCGGIIPFQLSVGNVKIIMRPDSSVGRQHLFIIKQGWGGLTTSECGDARHTRLDTKTHQILFTFILSFCCSVF